MGVKTTSDRVRSCGTTPVLGGALYQTVSIHHHHRFSGWVGVDVEGPQAGETLMM